MKNMRCLLKFRFVPYGLMLWSGIPQLLSARAIYDNFEDYSQGALPSSAPGGFGWEGGWTQTSGSGAPPFSIGTSAIASPKGYYRFSPHILSPTQAASAAGQRRFDAQDVIDTSGSQSVYFSYQLRRVITRDQQVAFLNAGGELIRIRLKPNHQLELGLRNVSNTLQLSSGGDLSGLGSDLLILGVWTTDPDAIETLSVLVVDAATQSVPLRPPSIWTHTFSVEMGTTHADGIRVTLDSTGSALPSDAAISEVRIAGYWDEITMANPRRIRYPQDARVLNVTQPPYHAQGNGVADDTQAIQSAIRDAITETDATGVRRIVYLPKGTYRITDTLEAYRNGAATGGGGIPSSALDNNLWIQGEGRDHTLLKLDDQAFGDSWKAMLRFHNDNSDFGNSAFNNYLRDLSIDTGSGNTQTTAVDFHGNNASAISRVTIRSGDGKGAYGIRADRSKQGPYLIEHVEVEGFHHGIRLHNGHTQTLEHIVVRHQQQSANTGYDPSGILVTNTSAALRNVVSVNTVPAIRGGSGRNALLTLIDADFSGATTGSAMIGNWAVYLDRIHVSGYPDALTLDGSAVPAEGFTGYVSDPREAAPSPDQPWGLEVADHPDYFDANLDNWVNVQSFGASATDTTDDRSAVQAAIDSGAKILYFPPPDTITSGKGEYRINNTLFWRNRIRKVEGLGQKLVAFNQVFSGDNHALAHRIEDSPQNTPLTFADMTFGITSIYEHRNIEYASSRDLIFSDFISPGLYNRPSDLGHLYGKNVVMAPWELIHPQTAWFRQFNAETFGDVNLLNNGGRVWILGFKSERGTMATHTASGGITEVFGGSHLAQWPTGADTPVHEVEELSALFSAFVAEGSNNMRWETLLTEHRDGTTYTLPHTSNGYIPLLTAYTSGFQPPGDTPRVAVLADTHVHDRASESGTGDSGAFRIVRLSGDDSQDLTLEYQLSGEATPGLDYQHPPSQIMLPAGQSEVLIPIVTLDDNLSEGTERIILNLTPSPGYIVGWPFSQSISIEDDEVELPAIPMVDVASWHRDDMTVSETGHVHTWQDLSGNHNHFRSTTFIRNPRSPVLDAATPPALLFKTDFMRQARSSDISFGSFAEKTWVMAFRTSDNVSVPADPTASTNNFQRQILYTQGNAARGLMLYIDHGELVFGWWNQNDPVTVRYPIEPNTTYVCRSVFDSINDQLILSVNNQTETGSIRSMTLPAMSSVADSSTLGAQYGYARMEDFWRGNAQLGRGTHPFEGEIMEFIQLNTVLAPEDSQTLYEYLANRYLSPSGPGSIHFVSPTASVSEADGSVTLDLIRSGGQSGSASVQVTSIPVTATAGEDFIPLQQSVSWSNGEAGIQSVSLALKEDTRLEGPEVLNLQLSAPIGASLGSPDQLVVSILDNEIPPPSTTGLVIHYPFEEASGTSTDNLQGTNHGSLTHSTLWAAGVSGSGLDFTAGGDSSQHLITQQGVFIPQGSAWTASIWVKLLSAPPASANSFYMVQQADQSGTGRTWLAIRDDRTLFSFIGGSRTEHNAPVSLNQWQHLAVSVENSTVRLYLDGTEVATGGAAIETTSGPFYLGNFKSPERAKQWPGVLDEFRLYSRRLTVEEIRNLSAYKPQPSHISAFAIASENNLTFELSTTPGLEYLLQSTDSLTGTPVIWSPLPETGTWVPSMDTTLTLEEPSAGNHVERYYRVLQREP